MAKANSAIQQFRKIAAEGQEIELPVSGITVRVRPISLTGLVRRGLIPSELYAAAMAGFPELEALASAQQVQATDLSKINEMAMSVENWYAAVLSEMMIDPPFNPDPGAAKDEGALVLEDFAGIEGDIQFLVGLAQIPVKNWEHFRERQIRRLQSMDDGAILEGEAE